MINEKISEPINGFSIKTYLEKRKGKTVICRSCNTELGKQDGLFTDNKICWNCLPSFRLNYDPFPESYQEHDWMGELMGCHELDNWQSLYIHPDCHIGKTAPFYRKKITTIPVIGVESNVYHFSEVNKEGVCSNRNCRSRVSFYHKKPIGHVFFFDIDERVDVTELKGFLWATSFDFGISHFIVTETTKGYHVYCLEIREFKAEWNELFRHFKKYFYSDYEYMSQWILRLGNKGRNPNPRVIEVIHNHNIVGTRISKAHLTLLEKYSGLEAFDRVTILLFNKELETFARLVEYNSWDV